MNQIWGIPRRGTPAQAEVREFMEEKKAEPAPSAEEMGRQRIISDKVAESKRTGKPVLFNIGAPQESAFGRAVREIREAQARKE